MKVHIKGLAQCLAQNSCLILDISNVWRDGCGCVRKRPLSYLHQENPEESDAKVHWGRPGMAEARRTEDKMGRAAGPQPRDRSSPEARALWAATAWAGDFGFLVNRVVVVIALGSEFLRGNWRGKVPIRCFVCQAKHKLRILCSVWVISYSFIEWNFLQSQALDAHCGQGPLSDSLWLKWNWWRSNVLASNERGHFLCQATQKDRTKN